MTLRKISKIVLIVLLVAGSGGWFIWYIINQPKTPENEIISRNGLHWHVDLSINILGESQDISAGIGLEKIPHKPMHTHDSDNIIHLEFPRIVEKDDIRLGRFFEIWGKTFNKDCIFDKCSGTEGKLKMFVNDKDNFEFENYIMKNGDRIEINFE